MGTITDLNEEARSQALKKLLPWFASMGYTSAEDMSSLTENESKEAIGSAGLSAPMVKKCSKAFDKFIKTKVPQGF